jgi:hypothetical protein
MFTVLQLYYNALKTSENYRLSLELLKDVLVLTFPFKEGNFLTY